MLLDTTSLMKTLDNINEKFLSGETINVQEGLEAARWIVTRQGEKGSYRGMSAPTQSDFDQGNRLFTGERLVSASARHIMGQEAARAAWLLGKQDRIVREAYHQATSWMHEAIDFQHSGTFCCGRCTLAYWRHFWVGDFNDKDAYLLKGLSEMRKLRLGDGKWRTLPFFYAIYTLVGIDLQPAWAELNYARPVMDRYLKSARLGDYSKRRVSILNKALEQIN